MRCFDTIDAPNGVWYPADPAGGAVCDRCAGCARAAVRIDPAAAVALAAALLDAAEAALADR